MTNTAMSCKKSMFSGPIKVTLWIVLCLTSIGLLLYTVVGLAERFASWPVTVVIEVEHVKEIDFPAITMCNINPVRLSAVSIYFY